MYFIDTNIFLEIALEQENSNSVRSFFQFNDLSSMFASELSLHSIGIMLFKLKKFEPFTRLVDELFIDGINLISLPISMLNQVKSSSEKL